MDQEITCVERDCGKTFTITESNRRYFTDNGLTMPKRCEDCRARRRQEKERQAEQGSN